MTYIANGFPKAGCHALQKGLELLGATGVELIHQPHPYDFGSDAKHICIFRHPRNCLISMCRFRGIPVSTGVLIGLIQAYGEFGPMAEYLQSYLAWRTDPNVLCIRYEDLTASDAALREIARFAGLPFLDDAFPNLPGLTMTWTGAPSRWQDRWSPALDQAWAESGMPAIEKELGY